MAVIYIRDVPEEVYRGFKSEAALAGKSLPRWALDRLMPGGAEVRNFAHEESPERAVVSVPQLCLKQVGQVVGSLCHLEKGHSGRCKA